MCVCGRRTASRPPTAPVLRRIRVLPPTPDVDPSFSPPQPGASPPDPTSLLGVHTDAQLAAALRPVPGRDPNEPVFVLFGSEWCSHCHAALATLDAARPAAAPGARFVAALVDGMGPAADAVKFTPSLVVYRRGRRVDAFVGADAQKLRDRVWLHTGR